MKRALHFATKPDSRDICVRGTRTQPLICVGSSVHYWVSCAINKGSIVHSSSSSSSFDALTHVVIRVFSAIIFQTLAEVCYSVVVNKCAESS